MKSDVKILLAIIILSWLFHGCAMNKEWSTPAPTSAQEVPLTTGNSAVANDSPDSVKQNFIPNLDNIEKLLTLKKNDVLEALGSNYGIFDAGAEHSKTGYYYEQFGMTLVFDETTDKISYIDCGGQVDIKVARLGMTFKEIEKILNDVEVVEITPIEPVDPHYALIYKQKNWYVWFGAEREESGTCVLEIRNWKI